MPSSTGKIVSLIGRPVATRRKNMTSVSVIHPNLTFSRFYVVHQTKNYQDSVAMADTLGGRLMTTAEARHVLRTAPDMMRSVLADVAEREELEAFWVHDHAGDQTAAGKTMGTIFDAASRTTDSCHKKCHFPVVVIVS
jgi:hypothetical protein